MKEKMRFSSPLYSPRTPIVIHCCLKPYIIVMPSCQDECLPIFHVCAIARNRTNDTRAAFYVVAFFSRIFQKEYIYQICMRRSTFTVPLHMLTTGIIIVAFCKWHFICFHQRLVCVKISRLEVLKFEICTCQETFQR